MPSRRACAKSCSKITDRKQLLKGFDIAVLHSFDDRRPIGPRALAANTKDQGVHVASRVIYMCTDVHDLTGPLRAEFNAWRWRCAQRAAGILPSAEAVRARADPPGFPTTEKDQPGLFM